MTITPKDNDGRKYEKVLFKLHKDSDGYPPDDWETLWAYEVDPRIYCVDSIPFYVRSVSWKDIISVKEVDGELHYDKVVRPSGHSVLRVITFDKSKIEGIRDLLQQLGCDTEQSHIPTLLSVDVPPGVDLSRILEILKKKEGEGDLEYEEACLANS